MNLTFKRMTKIMICVIGVMGIYFGVALSITAKANSINTAQDGQLVTVATKSDVPNVIAPNFLYGRGLVTEHQNDQAYNGILYSTSENYTSGIPTFGIFESRDNGASWNKISEVKDTVHGWGMRYQPFLYELPENIGDMPQGTLICIGNSIPSNLSATSLDMYKSLDHGKTWTYLSTVTDGGAASSQGKLPVWEPFIIDINHHLNVFYTVGWDSLNNPTQFQKLAHKTSVNGVSWSSEVNDVYPSRFTLHPGMATVAKMANGKYIMTYEVADVAGGGNHSYYKISDNGENWNPTGLGTKFADGGSPYVTSLTDGTVVANSTGSGLKVSKDNGQSWLDVNVPMSGGYSRSLTPLPNNKLLIVNGGGYAGTPYRESGDSIVNTTSNRTLTSMIYNLPSIYHRPTTLGTE